MDGPSSPEKPPVKRTYLERPKRKRVATETNNLDACSAAQHPQFVGLRILLEKSSGSSDKLISRRTLSSPGANNVTFTPPVPKRARHTSNVSNDSSIPSCSKKGPHRLPASAKIVGARSEKPPSSASTDNTRPPSSRHTSTDAEEDVNSVTAGSVISTEAERRSEPERIRYLKDEPYCGSLESYGAECIRCEKMVKFGKTRTYDVQAWEHHRRHCDVKVVSPSSICDDRDGSPRKYNTLGRRKAGAHNGLSEVSRRKLTIVNDSQVESFGARHIVCVLCKETIVLFGEEDYTLGSWEEHKSMCLRVRVKSSSKSKTATSTIPFPCSVPPSTTESTLIATESRQASLDLDSEDEEMKGIGEDGGEGNGGTGGDLDGMGWMMLPFRAFVRGFRESLKGG